MNMNLIVFLSLTRELFMDLLTVWTYVGFGWVLFGLKPRVKPILLAYAINVISHFVTRHLLPGNMFSYFLTAVDLIIVARILWYPKRGFTFWSRLTFSWLLAVMGEMLISLVFGLIYPDAAITAEIFGHQFFTLRTETYPLCYLLSILMMGIVVFGLYGAKRLWEWTKRESLPWPYLLRFALVAILMIVVMMLLGKEFDSIALAGMDERMALNEGKILSFVLYFLMGILLAFYAWQDLRQYRLHRDNRGLHYKNSAYQRVIESTREFRHNIANMIYGLEGVILGGDVAAIEAYYGEMARRCAVINNENAVALNRLQDPALTALILRKNEAAENQKIPFYINVDSGFVFSGLKTAEICEVLGNLIDNALEAAAKADAPKVDLSFCRGKDYHEIIIANTYSEGANLSFLKGEAMSSKPDHRATGLSSVRRILNRHKGLCFNQFRRGRYIESSLLEYVDA